MSSGRELSTPCSQRLLSDKGGLWHRRLASQPSVLLACPPGIGNPPCLISPHSRHLSLLWGMQRSKMVLMRTPCFAGFTGMVSLCGLAQLLSDFLVSSLQDITSPNCLSSCVERSPWVYLELKVILSLPGVGQHPALLFHYAWDLETDKRRVKKKKKKTVKATSFFFFFSIERVFSQKLMREKEIKVSRSLAEGHSREGSPQEGSACKEGLASLFRQ